MVACSFFFKVLPWGHTSLCSGECSGLSLLPAPPSAFHCSIRSESAKPLNDGTGIAMPEEEMQKTNGMLLG